MAKPLYQNVRVDRVCVFFCWQKNLNLGKALVGSFLFGFPSFPFLFVFEEFIVDDILGPGVGPGPGGTRASGPGTRASTYGTSYVLVALWAIALWVLGASGAVTDDSLPFALMYMREIVEQPS